MAAAPAVGAVQGSATGPPAAPGGSSGPASGLGRCRAALLLAVALDVAGMAALLTGVFAQLQELERDYGLRPSALARLARKLSRRWSAPAQAAGSRPLPGAHGPRRAARASPLPAASSRRVRLQLATLEAGPGPAGAGPE